MVIINYINGIIFRRQQDEIVKFVLEVFYLTGSCSLFLLLSVFWFSVCCFSLICSPTHIHCMSLISLALLQLFLSAYQLLACSLSNHLFPIPSQVLFVFLVSSSVFVGSFVLFVLLRSVFCFRPASFVFVHSSLK